MTFRNPPDHEQPADANTDNVYEITVVARDGGGMEGTLDVTITVTSQNEGPVISGTNSYTISENQQLLDASFTARDPEPPHSPITRWSLSGRDGGDFQIDETGNLTFHDLPDYERPADSNRDNRYELTVRASDGRYYGYYDVTVTVEPIDEPPVVSGRNTFTYRENATDTLYTYRATDPEWTDISWSVGGPDRHAFEISERGALTFKTPPDFDIPADDDGDNVFQVTVVATDLAGNDGTFDVAVTVTDLNEGPEIAGRGAITVSENHEPIRELATYTATDPENPSARITLWSVSGTDRGDFTINPSGQLTFRYSPDHERPADSNRNNEYLVTVRASDGRYYGYFNVAVTVDPVNEPPDITGPIGVIYRENGTNTVASYRATDPEGSGFTWGLSGADDDDFTISDTGVLSFISPPDYERPTDSGADNVYHVTVEATDDQSYTAQLQLTVTVTNLTD